ncbi:unnamed protein product, partial [marine sediment metagenome]
KTVMDFLLIPYTSIWSEPIAYAAIRLTNEGKLIVDSVIPKCVKSITVI